jgi:hypothetical protein
MSRSIFRLPATGETAVLRLLADQAFSRAAGAPLVQGNEIKLLRDAQEKYPAGMEAIGSARRTIDFETYLITRTRWDSNSLIYWPPRRRKGSMSASSTIGSVVNKHSIATLPVPSKNLNAYLI